MSDRIRLKYVFPAGILAILLCFTVGIMVTALVWADADEEPATYPEKQMVEVVSEPDNRAEIIAMSCAACHGTDGRKASAIPALAGKPFPVLNALLMAFKQDQMPDATVMPRLAKGYTDEELRAVAEYFASLSVE